MPLPPPMQSQPTIRERRQDPRVEPSGRVVLAPQRRGSPEEGGLVDVSARGLRIVTETLRLRMGAEVGVEIHLSETLGMQGRERCVLEGTGRVIWVRVEEGRCEAGILFDRPVRVRQPFELAHEV